MEQTDGRCRASIERIEPDGRCLGTNFARQHGIHLSGKPCESVRYKRVRPVADVDQADVVTFSIKAAEIGLIVVWLGYRNTIFYAVFGTAFSLILTIPSAYALSKKTLPGRGAISIFFLIPMYFNGGLIPTYLVMKQINMVDQWYSLIFIAASSVYNMIVTRVYFQSNVPEELYESARIDGASELRTFFSIALPLVKPIIAVMTLFFAVARWNDYFNALIYTTDNDYLPLQLVLRSILLNSQTALQKVDTSSMDADAIKNAARLAYMAEAMKYALIVVSSAPLLIAYPFVQKHFVKGMMIGAVKG